MPSEKIDSSVDNWENGALGCDPEFVEIATDIDLDKLVDESVGIKPVSIRLDQKMIDELKLFAEMEGLKYQPLIRVILARWLEGEKKRYVKYRLDQRRKEQEQEREELKRLEAEEGDRKRA